MCTRESNKMLRTLPFFDLLQNITQCFFSCGGSFQLISCSCVNSRTTANFTFFFLLVLPLVATLTQKRFPGHFFFFMLWPYLPERLCHHRPQRGFSIWVHSTEEASGRKWFWDGIQWWRGNLTQTPCRKTVCDADRNDASPNREVEMILSRRCGKTSAFLMLPQSENHTDKVMSHPASSRNCDWKTGIKFIPL